MSAFTLDTSGVVEGPINTPDGQRFDAIGWAFLDAFTQGYVGELFADRITQESLTSTSRVIRALGWTFQPAYNGWTHPNHKRPGAHNDDGWDAYPSDVDGDEVLDIEGLECFEDMWAAAPLGFSDLAPEALATILADCVAFRAYGARELFECIDNTAEHGSRFWTARNSQPWPSHAPIYARDGFPPLTVSLGDDGKVHLAVAA